MLVQPEFFQDEIFTDTLDTETSSLKAGDWLAGEDAKSRYLSLKPDGMTACESFCLQPTECLLVQLGLNVNDHAQYRKPLKPLLRPNPNLFLPAIS